MISILTLCLMVVVAVLVRPASIRGSERTSASRMRGRAGAKPAAPSARPAKDQDTPGVVTYALMKDRKLPSPAQRAFRRVLRPFSGMGGWFSRGPKAGPLVGPVESDVRRPVRPSAELENFLDARNREIAKRKAEGATKPGPDDMLH